MYLHFNFKEYNTMITFIVLCLNLILTCSASLFKKASYPLASLTEDPNRRVGSFRSAIECGGYFKALHQTGNHPSLEYFIFKEATRQCKLGTLNRLLVPVGAPEEQEVLGEILIYHKRHNWQ